VGGEQTLTVCALNGTLRQLKSGGKHVKLSALALLTLAASPTCAQPPAQSGREAAAVIDALGTWRTTHSAEAGISLLIPCKPELSYSDPQDGYGHTSELVELRCGARSNQGGEASFRIDRTTFKSAPGNVQVVFKKYMDFIRSIDSGSYKGPRVMIAGQQHETHRNYRLKQQGIYGDLGYHDIGDQCFWNFYGLAGDSIIQAIMTVPKSMCPTGSQATLTDAASRFYNSIVVEGI